MRDPQTTQQTAVRTPPEDVFDAPAQERYLLGRYRVLETRGTGGFGTVEMCWDERLQRRVAIKCMPLNVSASAQPLATMEEALTEARMSSMLSHPNIVTMFDFESDGVFAYLVMEYVDGLTLEELLARIEGGTLSHEECAHVLDSVASALEHAHKQGVLHLDIKPANIMIERNGTVKLADFGMATLASAAGYGDSRGGTVGYMPPEQLQGELVDERCDLFALAVVMWKALTGRSPFAAASAEESLEKIERGPRPRLSKMQPTLEGQVEQTFMQALEPDPAYRMASVDQFADLVVDGMRVDPHAGQASLRSLLSQLDDLDQDERYVPPRAPLLERLPWLPTLTFRLAAALCCAWIGDAVAPALGFADATERLIAAAAMAIAGASAPALGAGLIVAGLAVACALGQGGVPGEGLVAGGLYDAVGTFTGSELLAQGAGTLGSTAMGSIQPLLVAALVALVIIAGSAWWLSAGRSHELAGPALVLPSIISLPYGGVPLAGYALGPGNAFLTGALSWVLALTFIRCGQHGLSAAGLASALSAIATDRGALIQVAGTALAACASAALNRSGSRAAGLFGQVVGFAIVIGSRLVALRVENAGIWVHLPWGEVAFAVTLFGLTSLVAWAFGPTGTKQEGEQA